VEMCIWTEGGSGHTTVYAFGVKRDSEGTGVWSVWWKTDS